jgi:hypothetical protein
MAKAPLILTYYIAAPVEKVWDGFVSKEANRTIFMGADFEVDLRMSRVKVELTPETEAVKVVVTNDGFADDDPAYAQNADGWPDSFAIEDAVGDGENVPAPLEVDSTRRHAGRRFGCFGNLKDFLRAEICGVAEGRGAPPRLHPTHGNRCRGHRQSKHPRVRE